MDEDRLSPDLGRLIDRAKKAAGELGSGDPAVESVALLAEDGAIYAAAALKPGLHIRPSTLPAGSRPSEPSAAHLAVEKAQEAGAGEILAAAIAAPYDQAATAPPSASAYERLAGLDPGLPLVFKSHGRWVMLAADRVTPAS